MEFENYHHEVSRKVQIRTSRILNNLSYSFKKLPLLQSLLTSYINTTGNGKGLRGTLIIFGSQLCNFKPSEEIISIAAAFEILHSSLLIHDDVMDKGLLRRNKPTLYRSLGENHYAISQCICLGDLGFYLSWEVINQTKISPEIKQEILSVLNKTIIDTILGQMLDVELSQNNLKRSESDVLTIYKFKTAVYSLVAPLLIGAILSKQPRSVQRYIKKFGTYLGIAYQIQDDILGCFGNEILLGKSIFSDIEEGKNTLLIAYALKHSDKIQEQFLKQSYGKGTISPHTHQKVLQIFQDTGALTHAQAQAAKYIKFAKSQILYISPSKNDQDILKGLADFIVNRHR